MPSFEIAFIHNTQRSFAFSAAPALQAQPQRQNLEGLAVFFFRVPCPICSSFLRPFYCICCQEVRVVGICKICQTVPLHIACEPKRALTQMEKRHKRSQARLSHCVGRAESKHRLLSPDLEDDWKIIPGTWRFSLWGNMKRPLPALEKLRVFIGITQIYQYC